MGTRRTIALGLALVGAIALTMICAGVAGAFPTYRNTVAPGIDDCFQCHDDFRLSPYVSPKGDNWGDDLHDRHRNTMLGVSDASRCNICHSGTSRSPVYLNQSNGTTGFDPIACVGCHGRVEDRGVRPADCVDATATTGPCGDGAGLRQHHTSAGETSCQGCHTDAAPLAFTPVGENVKPPYYFTPDVLHPTKPTDPCNPPPSFPENYGGSTLGLDNNGNGVYDMADASCAAPTVTAVPTQTPVQTATPIKTATPVVTATPTQTAVPTVTATPAVTATPIKTATPVVTATPAQTAVPTVTATPAVTATPTETPTPTETRTPVPPTVTMTPVVPTVTVTAAPPTVTPTEVGPTPVAGELVIRRARVRRSNSSRGEVIVKADILPISPGDSLDVSAGVGVQVTDGLTLNEQFRWNSGECREFRSGVVVCRNVDRKAQARFMPTVAPGFARLSLRLDELDINGPFAGPITVRIEEAIARTGTIDACRITPNSIKCVKR